MGAYVRLLDLTAALDIVDHKLLLYSGWLEGSDSSGYMVPYWTGSGRTCQAERSMSCLAAASHVLFTFSARCFKVQCWVRCCSLTTWRILRTLWTSMAYFYMRLPTTHRCIFTVIATTCRLLPLSWNCVFPRWPVDSRQSPQTQH